MPRLDDRFELADQSLPNRIVMAPMTRSRVEEGDALGEMNAQYYSQRAEAGLIISEALVVCPAGRGYLWTPGLYTQAQVDGAQKVTEAVHVAGGRIFAQLWHVGRVSSTSVLPDGAVPLAPSDTSVEGLYVFGRDAEGNLGKVRTSPARAMSESEIAETISAFADAAVRAKDAGFDGIELLAANGYIFDQFLNSDINVRTGRYGGATANTRCAFLLDTVDAIRNRLPDFPMGIRLSPFGTFNEMPIDPQTSTTHLHAAAELENRHIAYVHFNDEPVSIGHLNDEVVTNVPNSEASVQWLIPRAFLREFRRAFTGPVIFCGGLGPGTAQEMLDSGLADLVGFATHFIANPDLPRRLIEGLPLAEPNTALFYGGGHRGYTDYPRYR